MPVEIAALLGACLLLVLISVAYFSLGKALPLRPRVAASAHAALVEAILPYGLSVDAATSGDASSQVQLPIFLLLILGAASMVFSLWAFRDKPLLHFAHLITIALAIPLTFVGAVAIVGWT